jgi:hypothetical protein
VAPVPVLKHHTAAVIRQKTDVHPGKQDTPVEQEKQNPGPATSSTGSQVTSLWP